MAHLIACPECDKHLQVPEGLLGKKVQCPECKTTFTAALPEEAPGEPEPPKKTEKPSKWDKQPTKAGVNKKTKRRDDDEEDEEDDDEDDDHRRRKRSGDDEDDEGNDDDRRRRRSYDDDDDDEDDNDDYDRRRRSSRGRSEPRPGKVQGIGIMALIGGILATLLFLGLAGGSGLACCLWPGTYYSLVVGILAIIKGSAILGSNARSVAPPVYIGVMMIINIINGDLVNLVLGILILVFCGDEEVKEYLRGE
jgi:hypothetical protein